MENSTFDTVHLTVTIVAFFSMPVILWRILQSKRYDPLRESGTKINMNLLTLWAAFLRKSNDPLKPLHLELCYIGSAMFLGFLAWFFVVPIAHVMIG